MLFQKARHKRRINKGLCPYCKQLREIVRIYDGFAWNTATICPDRHFAMIFILDYRNEDALGISYQMVDNSGAVIPIPWEHIEFLADMKEEE